MGMTLPAEVVGAGGGGGGDGVLHELVAHTDNVPVIEVRVFSQFATFWKPPYRVMGEPTVQPVLVDIDCVQVVMKVPHAYQELPEFSPGADDDVTLFVPAPMFPLVQVTGLAEKVVLVHASGITSVLHSAVLQMLMLMKSLVNP